MNHKRLQTQIERQARRMKKAEQDKPNLIAQTAYIGTLGLLMVLPIVVGAYLGHWLDKKVAADYSFSWTISLIIVGVFIGAFNVYLYIKDKE